MSDSLKMENSTPPPAALIQDIWNYPQATGFLRLLDFSDPAHVDFSDGFEKRRTIRERLGPFTTRALFLKGSIGRRRPASTIIGSRQRLSYHLILVD